MRLPPCLLPAGESPSLVGDSKPKGGSIFSKACREPEALGAVVAIPARNEEAHIPVCLAALAAQVPGDATFGVLLLLNNCVDGSLEAAKTFQSDFGARLRIVTRRLGPARSHAGGARRLAMELAAAWLEEQGATDGLLLTTDADSRVTPTWVADNRAAVAAGADAVAGDVSLDPVDEAQLPDALRRRGALEATYGRQLVEIAALLDPEPHNPWPHHATISGASLGLTLAAYRSIGGLPALPLGEDKALIEALRASKARIRFAPEVNVITSGRLFGRAAGGVADTMRLRCEEPDAPCDSALEPVDKAILRAAWRGVLRRAHVGADLGVSLGAALERRLPRPVGVAPTDLPTQIRRAGLALTKLRARSGALREIQPELIESFVADLVEETVETV